MSPVLLVTLLALLFISLFVIIPKYAPAGQEEIIQDWVGLGFNCLLFLMVLYQTRLRYRNVYYAISLFMVSLAIALSGVYWWIPKYIKPEKQAAAVKDMFTSLSIAIIVTNMITKAVPVRFKRFNDQ